MEMKIWDKKLQRNKEVKLVLLSTKVMEGDYSANTSFQEKYMFLGQQFQKKLQSSFVIRLFFLQILVNF